MSTRGVVATARTAVAGGVLATVTMDSAMAAAMILGGKAWSSERLSLQMIGRWGAGLLRGCWRHDDVLREEPVPGELALGVATHYATGIALTTAYVVASGSRRPSLWHGVVYGLATAALPLLVLFPSMGYGWFGRRSGEAGRMARTMLVGHLAFGAGIAFWTRRLTKR